MADPLTAITVFTVHDEVHYFVLSKFGTEKGSVFLCWGHSPSWPDGKGKEREGRKERKRKRKRERGRKGERGWGRRGQGKEREEEKGTLHFHKNLLRLRGARETLDPPHGLIFVLLIDSLVLVTNVSGTLYLMFYLFTSRYVARENRVWNG